MATAVKRKFSQSTNGRGIKVVATATAGTAIHTVVAGTTDGTYDEIWLWAYNSDTVDRLLTIEFGGTTAPDDHVKVTIQAQAGWVLVLPGLILQNGLGVAAFASAANVVAVQGFINAITD